MESKYITRFIFTFHEIGFYAPVTWILYLIFALSGKSSDKNNCANKIIARYHTKLLINSQNIRDIQKNV